MVDLRVQRLDSALCAVLVEEAQEDAEGDDRGDDEGVGRVARESRYGCAPEQQQEQRVAKLPQQHAEPGDPVYPQDVAALAREQFSGLR